MSKKKRQVRVDRRSFLASLGGVSAVAVATTTVDVLPAAAAESESEMTKARYQETDHVKTYYQTNRY
jgi:hypothetical protein